MKISKTILTTAVLLSCGTFITAQDNTSQQETNRQDQQSQQSPAYPGQSSQGDANSISEPSGAEPSAGPQGRPFSTNIPPGRAFSTNNPPEGRPFEEGGRPPGRAFEQDQAVEEPAGAEQPGATNQQSDANEPAGAQSDTSSDSSTDASQAEAEAATPEVDAQGQRGPQAGVNEPAGAQRAGSEQIATALGTLGGGGAVGGTGQNIQLRQAIKTSIQGKQVGDEYIDRLSTDLSMAFKSGEIKQEVRTELAQSLHTVLTAQPTAQAEVEQALSRIQTILIDNGATRPAARSVACDLHLIATEMHPNLQLSVPVPR